MVGADAPERSEMMNSKEALRLYSAFVAQNGRAVPFREWLGGTIWFYWEEGVLETSPLGGGGTLAETEGGVPIKAAPPPEGEDLSWLREELWRIGDNGPVHGWITAVDGLRVITLERKGDWERIPNPHVCQSCGCNGCHTLRVMALCANCRGE